MSTPRTRLESSFDPDAVRAIKAATDQPIGIGGPTLAGQAIAAGLVDEVRALQARGDLDPDLPSLRAVGYRQIWQYLDGECSLEEAVAAARQATRNLAKRQLTWLRGDPAIAWVQSLAERDLVPIYDAVARAAGKIGAKSLC